STNTIQPAISMAACTLRTNFSPVSKPPGTASPNSGAQVATVLPSNNTLHTYEPLTKIPRHGPVRPHGGLGAFDPSGSHWSHDFLCPRLAQTGRRLGVPPTRHSLGTCSGSRRDALPCARCLGLCGNVLAVRVLASCSDWFFHTT